MTPESTCPEDWAGPQCCSLVPQIQPQELQWSREIEGENKDP